jgi:predicted nucleic acid-binding protein
VIRALLDTNVVLDYFLDRAPFAAAAAEIWRANEEGRIATFVSVITPVNVFYVARKLTGVVRARQVVESLLAACDVCAPDRKGSLPPFIQAPGTSRTPRKWQARRRPGLT